MSIDRLRMGFSAGSSRQCGDPGLCLTSDTHSQGCYLESSWLTHLACTWTRDVREHAQWSRRSFFSTDCDANYVMDVSSASHALIREAKSWIFVFLYSPLYVRCASTVCFIQSTVRGRAVDCIKRTVDAQWTHSGRTVDVHWTI